MLPYMFSAFLSAFLQPSRIPSIQSGTQFSSPFPRNFVLPFLFSPLTIHPRMRSLFKFSTCSMQFPRENSGFPYTIGSLFPFHFCDHRVYTRSGGSYAGSSRQCTARSLDGRYPKCPCINLHIYRSTISWVGGQNQSILFVK